MTINRIRVFEGTNVPATFEKLLVPRGADPDGLGPLSDEDRRFYLDFEKIRKGWGPPLKRQSKELYEHQKYQLKNSHVIADAKGEAADNMNLEDICTWLAKLGVLIAHNPDHVFNESVTASRYGIASWAFGHCETAGAYLELIAAVAAWNEGGALESTAYPGDRAIDGDGNYPIFVVEKDIFFELMAAEFTPEEMEDLGKPPARTQSKSFLECQFQKGHSGNKGGRPRRPLDAQGLDERRPHYFDTLMPPDRDGNQVTYGEYISDLARSRAVRDEDWEWFSQMNAWARELDRLRRGRKKFRNGGFVYEDTLEVTRIDIAIRHLEIAAVEWRKSPAARWVINPELVGAALARMKKSDLTREEMEGIYVRTRKPQDVDWLRWWPQDLRCKHSKNEQLQRPRRKISGSISKQ